ncbi:MAG: ABC transporter ATP-binding protein [Gemmataceae bacterium]
MSMMIHVDDVTKYFGPVLAVDHISFEVAEGEIVGYLGPNGAGKTTSLRILTTYLPATSGVARVAGHDVMTESLEVRRKIGYLPDQVPMYPEMRVEEYLSYRAKLKGVPRAGRAQRIDYCLERCRAREVRRRLIGTLSRGYRQRVGLADAMIHDPRILILDEPTVGLDPVQIRETLALIKELGESRTILLSTHILAEVEAVCKRVIIIHAGQLSLDKPLKDMGGTRLIAVEARGPGEAIAKALNDIDGVEEVSVRQEEDGLFSFDLKTRDNADLRESVSRKLAENSWPIRNLMLRRSKLEDVFLEVVRQRDPLKQKQDAKAGAKSADEKEKQPAESGKAE